MAATAHPQRDTVRGAHRCQLQVKQRRGRLSPPLGLTGGEAEFPFTQLWSQKARDPLELL